MIDVVRRQALPRQLAHLRATVLTAWRRPWDPAAGPEPRVYSDGDLAKWLEAAANVLAVDDDQVLSDAVEEITTLLAAAQLEDGYLNSYFTTVAAGQQLTNLEESHELFCAGHLIEAGIAHYEATGQRSLFDVVRRFADFLVATFGDRPGQRAGYDGHEGIEWALMRLARVTGDHRYRRLAQYFLEQRGQEPPYFVNERTGPNRAVIFGNSFDGESEEFRRRYNQSHAPIRDQTTAVGHAVRAIFLYRAMTELAEQLDDSELRSAVDQLWDDVTTRHRYLTGGIGSVPAIEGFGRPWELPNDTAYAETCAAIALGMWAHDLNALHRDGHYADVLEQVLYNGALSGLGLDGRSYLYANPLASDGAVARREWFGCACCPPHVARLVTSLGRYGYLHRGDEILVALYLGGQARFAITGVALTIDVTTDYPFGDVIDIAIRPDEPVTATISLRIPGWCDDYTVVVNDEPVRAPADRGYLSIRREWRAGDRISLRLGMPVVIQTADSRIAANRGRRAVTRGPLVYCAESVDNPALAADPDALMITDRTRFEPTPIAMPSLVSITGLMSTDDPPVRLVPYFAWNNRGTGSMRVWLRTTNLTEHHRR